MAGTLFHLAYRADDQCFVVRDATEADVFAGTYQQVEFWLDQYENGGLPHEPSRPSGPSSEEPSETEHRSPIKRRRMSSDWKVDGYQPTLPASSILEHAQQAARRTTAVIGRAKETIGSVIRNH